MIISLLIIGIQAYSIVIQKPHRSDIPVVSDGVVSARFQNKYLEQTQCHPTSQFAESYVDPYTDFVITNNQDKSINYQIRPSSKDIKIVKLKYDQNEGILKPNSSETLRISYNCQSESQLKETWTMITLETKIDDKVQQLRYYKLCQQPEYYLHPLLILITVAVSLIIIGAYYGQKELRIFGEVQQEEVGIKTVILFIFVASTMLMILYFFANVASYILLVWVGIISIMSMEITILDIIQNVSSFTKFNQVFAYSIAGIVVVEYIITKNWMLSNLLSLTNTLMMFRIIEIDNYRSCTLLLCLAFFYDIFWVFISGYFFGESVMASVATSIDLPMKFSCPSIYQQLNTPYLRCSLLGLGDILLPGIMIKYILKFEKQLNKGLPLFITAIIGYITGLLFCILALVQMGVAQPALLYIVPCTLIPITLVACYQDTLSQLWRGQIDIVVPRVQYRIEHAYELTGEI